MKKNFLTIIILFSVFVYSNAQQFIEPVFRQIDAEQLGVKSVRGQVWDSQGTMWLISDKGLLSYNGYKTYYHGHHFENENSPLSDNLLSIHITGHDEFWITYLDTPGFSKFNPIQKKFTHVLPDSTRGNNLPYEEITKIVRVDETTLYLLTWGGGLVWYNDKTGAAKTFKKTNDSVNDSTTMPCNFMKDMAVLGDGKFLLTFFSEEDGTIPHYFDSKTETFTKFPLEDYFGQLDTEMRYAIKLSLFIIHFIDRDENGNFWIGSYCGLLFVDVANKTIQRVSVKGADLKRQNLENTRNYIIDERGYMWVGTPNQGIMIVNRSNGNVAYVKHNPAVVSSLGDNRVLTMSADPSGNIWVATGAGSYSIYNPLIQKFALYPWHSMSLDFTNRSKQTIPVNQMYVLSTGNILLSSETGIVEFDPNYQVVTDKIEPMKLLRTTNTDFSGVGNFKVVGDHIFMMNGYKKSIYFKNSNKIKQFDDEFKEGKILFRHMNVATPIIYFQYKSRGDTTALYILDTATFGLSPYYVFTEGITISENYSFVLKSGKWFLSEANGRFVIFDPVTKTHQLFGHKNADVFFQDSTARCAYLDKEGMVWIGTANGLYRFDETTNEAEKYNEQLSLQDQETVNAIIQDKNGVMWIALSKDLLRWDESKNELFRFDKRYGLQSGSFLPAVAQTDSYGKIYLASYNGILIFDPQEIQIPSAQNKLFLSSVDLFETPLAETEMNQLLMGEKTFSHDENFLSFEFHTNEVFALIQNHFFFRLVGRDKDWQDNGASNKIRFADLNYGDYSLEVKVLNAYGNESNILQIPFRIKKPFWLTFWFYLVIVLIAGVTIVYYVKFRERALRKRSIELERIVTDRTAEVVREKGEAENQRQQAEHQREIVEEKQKEITDSINYAKRIQDAYLPNEKVIKHVFKEAFILFKPKDIVSGDFYWFYNTGLTENKVADEVFVAVADCTGHGVPGAIMSVICCNALNEVIVNQKESEPSKVLDRVREIIIKNLKSSTHSNQKDGMDIALCKLNTRTRELFYSGAHNPLWIYRKSENEIEEIKADKQPVGMFDFLKPFTNHTIQLNEGDTFYIFSDGFADQFGGPKGKKLKSSTLRQLLLQNVNQPVDIQKEKLIKVFNEWKGDLEQVDDVCLIGVSV